MIDHRSFKIFSFLDSTVTMGTAAYNTLLPLVDRPRPFQSMARIDEVMVNYSYDQRHAHQLGLRAIVHLDHGNMSEIITPPIVLQAMATTNACGLSAPIPINGAH
jgi:hypothetical protein